MLLVGLLLFSLVFFALMLWGSIYVVDKLNPYNKFAMALFISAANIGASMMIRFLPFADMIYLVGSLCLLLRLLVAYYQLDLVRALLAAGLTIGAPFLILPKFGEWVGLDFMRLYILCYGFPAVVVVAWQVLKRRTPKDLAEHSPIPRATVANEDRKGKKSRRREDTAPVAAVPAVRSAPIVAPAAPPPRADGEPTMLT
jgi:hypothetical protein